MSASLITYVLKAAIRDRLIIAMLVLIALTTSMSLFMASSAITEQDQFLAVYSSGSLRVLGILGLVIFTAFFVRRSFDAKDVEFLLSRPISRTSFILSHAVAFSILATLIAAASTLALLITSPDLAGNALLLWAVSIVVEAIIMVNMAFFFAMFLSSAATAVLAVLAFYVLSRMMGQILGILESGTAGSIMEGVQIAMNMVSTLTPRLDLMGQTTWLVYGVEGSPVGLAFILIQGAVFLSVVLVAALIDLILRQF